MIVLPWARWLPRLILATLAAVIPLATELADSFAEGPRHQLEIDLAASTPGVLQVFYDRGRGLSEAESGTVRIAATDQPARYRVPLPLGRYRVFRIDPNHLPGRYIVHGLRIVDMAGDVIDVLDPTTLRAAAQVSLESGADGSMAIITTPDANDPQVIYDAVTLVSAAPDADVAGAGRLGLGILVALLVLATLLDRWAARAAALAATAAWMHRRPAAAVVAAGLLASLAATYPLLLGRSAVSPMNGGTHVLYDQPPYAYGSRDDHVEDSRGTDVGAMMWAILPYTMVQREAIAAGEFPLWNRYNAIGEPLWGQGQTFILDPMHLLSLAIPDPALAMDLRFIVGRVTFAVGTGLTVALVTGHAPAAVLVTLMAPFVGHFTARFNHPAYFSLVWAPWILLAYAHLARQQTLGTRLRAGAWLALATWLQLVGSTPKEGLIALGAAHLAGVVGLLSAGGPWRDRLRGLSSAVAGGVTAILLGAPHWLIFLDTLAKSWTLYDQPSVQLADRHFLLAYMVGPTVPGLPLTGTHPLAVMAALAALCAPRALLRSGVGLGAAVATAAVGGIAFGVVPTEWLVRLPLIANIHQVANVFLGATVPLVLIVAGVGLASALRAGMTGLPPLAMGAALGLMTAALLLPPQLVSSSLLALVTVAVGALTLLVVGIIPVAPTASTVLAMGLALMLATGAGGLQVVSGIAPLDAALIQPRPRADLDAPSPVIAALQSRAGGEPFRVAPVDGVLFAGTQAYWGLEGIGGPDALRLAPIEALFDAAGIERTTWQWRTVLAPASSPTIRALLDMLNVRFLVSRPDLRPADLALVPVDGRDLLEAVERPTPWPRAFFAAGIRSHDDLSGLMTHLTDSNGPFASVNRQELSVPSEFKGLPASGAVIAATSYQFTPNSTSFRVETTSTGIAVLAEAFAPGDFVATVNGRAVPYIRVNHAFKGVRIPGAGAWDVRFTYRPARWTMAWLAAALGAMIWLAMLMAKPLLK